MPPLFCPLLLPHPPPFSFQISVGSLFFAYNVHPSFPPLIFGEKVWVMWENIASCSLNRNYGFDAEIAGHKFLWPAIYQTIWVGVNLFMAGQMSPTPFLSAIDLLSMLSLALLSTLFLLPALCSLPNVQLSFLHPALSDSVLPSPSPICSCHRQKFPCH